MNYRKKILKVQTTDGHTSVIHSAKEDRHGLTGKDREGHLWFFSYHQIVRIKVIDQSAYIPDAVKNPPNPFGMQKEPSEYVGI